jgi:hypothetical protein
LQGLSRLIQVFAVLYTFIQLYPGRDTYRTVDKWAPTKAMARIETSQSSNMQAEKGGHIPRLLSWMFFLVMFCAWILFGLLLFVHFVFIISDSNVSEPYEEAGEYESSE